MKMANTYGTSHLQKHKDGTTKIHNLNNLADVSIQGRHFTHTLLVLPTAQEGNKLH